MPGSVVVLNGVENEESSSVLPGACLVQKANSSVTVTGLEGPVQALCQKGHIGAMTLGMMSHINFNDH